MAMDAILKISGLADDSGFQKDTAFCTVPLANQWYEFCGGESPGLSAVADGFMAARGAMAPMLFFKDVAKCASAAEESRSAKDLRGRVMKGCDAAYYAMGAATRISSFMKFIDAVAKFFPQALGRIAAGVMWVVGVIHNFLTMLRALWDMIKISIALSYLTKKDGEFIDRIDPSDRKGPLARMLTDPVVDPVVKQEQINKIFWNQVINLIFQCSVWALAVLSIILTLAMPVVGFWFSLAMLAVSNILYFSGLTSDIFEVLNDPKMKKTQMIRVVNPPAPASTDVPSSPSSAGGTSSSGGAKSGADGSGSGSASADAATAPSPKPAATT